MMKRYQHHSHIQNFHKTEQKRWKMNMNDEPEGKESGWEVWGRGERANIHRQFN